MTTVGQLDFVRRHARIMWRKIGLLRRKASAYGNAETGLGLRASEHRLMTGLRQRLGRVTRSRQ